MGKTAAENSLDKVKLINELKEIHIKLVVVYKKIFEYKYASNNDFRTFIDSQYEENSISSKERMAWNDNFCHRASYTLLNKILFIRICEDKGLMLKPEGYIEAEPKDSHEGEILPGTGLQIWVNLVTNYTLGELIKFVFLDMKDSYENIVLYKEGRYEVLNPTNEELSLKCIGGNEKTWPLVLEFEEIINSIIEKLDTKNFNFRNTDSNILGDVYEKFMDRETRKAIGQFYTPEFVIEYILKNTVAEEDVVENPFVSVVDIACGSGHFLIMAYDILRDKFINNLETLREKYAEEIYTIKRKGREEQLKGKDYWKKENIHYHLLKHCIYGADIDSFAVQLTTINLLLKDLGNFTGQPNIIECDSLVKWEEDYDWQNLRSQLKDEFEKVEYTKADLIGEEEKVSVTKRKELFRLRYKDISGSVKTEEATRERAEEIANICGFWSRKYDYIVGNPPYIPITQMSEINKRYYKERYRYSKGRTNTFSLFFERTINKKYSNVAFIVPSRILLNTQYTGIREYILKNCYIKRIADLSEGVFEDATVDTVIIILSNDCNGCKRKLTTVEKIKENTFESKELDQNLFLKFDNSYINIYVSSGEIDLISKIKNASVRLGDIADIRDGIIQGAVGDELFLGKRKVESDNCKKVLFGENIDRYSVNWNNEYIFYDKEYLTKLENERTRGKGRGLRLREPSVFERSKILTRQTADRIIAAYDTENMYYMNTLHGTHVIDDGFDELYVLAVMNSNIINFYYTRYNYEVGKAFAQVKIENLNNLPIIKMNFRQQKYISELCSNILEIKNKIKSSKYYCKNIGETLNETKEQILRRFIECEKNNNIPLNKYCSNLILIDFYLYKYLELDRKEIELVESVNGRLSKEKVYIINELYPYHSISLSELDEVYNHFLDSAANEISADRLIELIYISGKSIDEIASNYNYEYNTISLLQEHYLSK